MVGISQEVIELIEVLLPGFVATWIYYGITAHRKQSPFERAVQALILTAVVRALVIPIGGFFRACANVTGVALGSWTANVEFVWAMMMAVILGHAIAWAANTNSYHSLLYRWGFTLRTSYPSEWYSTFAQLHCYIVLHLDGERRLYGWPFEWPDHPDSGHFVIQEPAWLLDDNTMVPLIVDEVFLVPVSSVELVEVLKNASQLEGQEHMINNSENLLLELRSNDSED